MINPVEDDGDLVEIDVAAVVRDEVPAALGIADWEMKPSEWRPSGWRSTPLMWT